MFDLGSIANTTPATLANSATPSVSGGVRFVTGGTTTITNFTGGVLNQVILVIPVNAITFTNGTNLLFHDNVDRVISGSDIGNVFTCLQYQSDNKWHEICRGGIGYSVYFAAGINGLVAVYLPWGAPYIAVLSFPGGIFGEESGYVAGSIDFQMAFDGTGNSYRAFDKRRKILKWDYLPAAKKVDLETLWAFAGQFVIADAVDPVNQFTGIMLAEPKMTQDYQGKWAGSVEVQQI